MHTPIYEISNGEYVVSNNKDKLNVDLIHAFLEHSYWAEGISRDKVESSIKHAVCFGLYFGKSQIGFARVVTDFTRFAYLADVFIIEEYQGKGLGALLMKGIFKHPSLHKIKRWMLATKDAHPFYKQFGFEPLTNPEDFMELMNL